jgi:hypothetical protein
VAQRNALGASGCSAVGPTFGPRKRYRLRRFRGGPDACEPSRLAVGWGLRRFHRPILEPRGPAKGRGARTAARNHYSPPREEPEHLHRPAIRGQRLAECRGVHKRRLRSIGAIQSTRKWRSRLLPAFLWSASPSDRSRRKHHVSSRDSRWLFRAIRQGGHTQRRRSEGSNCWNSGLETSQHIFLSAMATLVGLDPAKDIEWMTSAKVKPIDLFAEGKIDAFLGFPPEPQRLRAQNIGHVIVNSTRDRPWRSSISPA